MATSTYNFSIKKASDDLNIVSIYPSVSDGATMVQVAGQAGGNPQIHAVFRFEETHNIPRKAVIESAFLTLEGRGISPFSFSNATMLITTDAILEGNPSQISSYGNYNVRNKTNGVTWYAPGITSTLVKDYTSTDLKPVIQQLVNLPDWTNNSPIVLIQRRGRSDLSIYRLWTAYEGNPAKAARLEVNYSVPLPELNTLYTGATATLAGASYLDSRTILGIKEGYYEGGSNHLNNIGDFEVKNYNDRGAFNQTLDLTAYSIDKRLDYNNDILNRSLSNTSPYALSQKGSISTELAAFEKDWVNVGSLDWVGRTSGPVASTSSNGTNSIAYLGKEQYDNFTLSAALRPRNGIAGNNDVRISLNFRSSSDFAEQLDGFYGYSLTLTKPASTTNGFINLRKLTDEKLNSPGGITLASSALSIQGTAPVYVRVTAFENKIDVFAVGGTIPFGATMYGRMSKLFSVVDNTYSRGQVSLAFDMSNPDTNPGTMNLDDFNITPIRGFNTYKKVLKNINSIVGNDSVSFADSLSGISGYYAVTGTSWVTGATTNELTNVVSGSSESYYFSNGSSFRDFVLECQVKGNSSNGGVGTLVGTTNSFYALKLQFGASLYAGTAATSTTSIIHRTSNITEYGNQSTYLAPIPDTWYNLALIKKNNWLSWYLEDTLCASIFSGLSDNNNIGFYVSGSSNIGAFRDIKISELSIPVEDTLIQVNQSLSQSEDRFQPEGYQAIVTGSTLEYVKVGTSRGVMEINGNSQILMNSMQSVQNVDTKVMSAINKDSILIELNKSRRTSRQLDSVSSASINDSAIQTNQQSEEFIEQTYKQLNRDELEATPDMTNLPLIQKYDRINYVDPTLGISKQLLVYNFNKSYDPTSGSFRINLSLAE